MTSFKQWLHIGAMAISVMTLTPAAFAQEPPKVEGKVEAPPPPPPVVAPPPAPKPSLNDTLLPTGKGSSTQATSSTSSSSGGWKNALVVLLFVAMAGGAAWYVKNKRIVVPGATRVGNLRVIDTVRLGQQSYLVTAYVGGRIILLGVSEGGIRRLAWLKPDMDVQPDAEMSVQSPVQGRSPRPNHRQDSVPAPPKTLGGFAEALKGLLATRHQQAAAHDDTDGEAPHPDLPPPAIADRFDRSRDDRSRDDRDEARHDARHETRSDPRRRDDRDDDEEERYAPRARQHEERPRATAPTAPRRYDIDDEPAPQAPARAPQTTAEFLASKTRDVVERRPTARASQPRQPRARHEEARSEVARQEPRSEVRVSQTPALEEPRAALPSVPPPSAGVEGQVNGLRRRAGRNR